MRSVLALGALGIILLSCSQRTFIKKLSLEFNSIEISHQDHTGFLLYDPITKKTLFDYNSSRYFTPASNTKILTFYTSLQILGDSVPALKYVVRNDSLIFWGTGDPSFFYDKVWRSDNAFNFLKNATHPLYFSSSNFKAEHFGPGWAWDDYNFTFSSERTPLPLFGNYFSLASQANDSLNIMPAPFLAYRIRSSDKRNTPQVIRDKNSNHFTFYPGKRKLTDTLHIPYQYSDTLLIRLLSDTLKRKVSLTHTIQPADVHTVQSIPTDSLYRVMMEDSDNFIAEQLLLLCADAVSDTLNAEIAINYSKKNFFFDLPDNVLWRDGSGLSRYNLFTPRSIVRVWEKIYDKVPKERLFSLLATGGESGTIKNYFKGEHPYIFGKTGTLSNNYSLSGFVITKTGKTLIFSWMNNNYPSTVSGVRKSMEPIMELIRDHY